MAIEYESIGKRIKSFRTERDLSQEELGVLISANSHHVSNIENGRRAPSLESLVLIANALQVSADDLLVDSLTNSKSTAGSEIHKLLLDCNEDEKKMLTKILQFMKTLLIEFGI